MADSPLSSAGCCRQFGTLPPPHTHSHLASSPPRCCPAVQAAAPPAASSASPFPSWSLTKSATETWQTCAAAAAWQPSRGASARGAVWRGRGERDCVCAAGVVWHGAGHACQRPPAWLRRAVVVVTPAALPPLLLQRRRGWPAEKGYCAGSGGGRRCIRGEAGAGEDGRAGQRQRQGGSRRQGRRQEEVRCAAWFQQHAGLKALVPDGCAAAPRPLARFLLPCCRPLLLLPCPSLARYAVCFPPPSFACPRAVPPLLPSVALVSICSSSCSAAVPLPPLPPCCLRSPPVPPPGNHPAPNDGAAAGAPCMPPSTHPALMDTTLLPRSP